MTDAFRFLLLSLTISLTGSSVALAGNSITVGRQVPSAERVPMDQIDHRLWDGLLKKYVDGAGRVDYKNWKKSARDVAALDSYLNSLSSADRQSRTGREAYLSFWINAYNALTIKGILREYPTSSIRNHTARVYGYNIWHDLILHVGASKVSLHKIEHEILRKSGEPRIHFAIVCASHSCPRLRDEAYTAAQLERQLSENTRAFFADRENFRYANGRFYLSSIMKWFAEDFGSTPAAQLRSIATYLPDRKSRFAAMQGDGRISYLKYDWSLNDQATVDIR